MSNDPNNIATDPAALMAEMECCDNAIIAARFDGPPPKGMVTGLSPDGISSGGIICTPAESSLGVDFVQELGVAANLPACRNDFAATFSSAQELLPKPAPDEPDMRPA